MTGTPIPAIRTQPRRQARPAAHHGIGAEQVDAQLNFTWRQCRSAQLHRHLEGHAHRAPRRQLLALSSGPRHQRQHLHRRQAPGRHRRLPGRRPWRHPASQPGQRHPHHRWPRQRAPRGRSDRRPARHRSQDQPRHLGRARPGAPQLVHARAAPGRPRRRHRRRQGRKGRGRLRVDAPPPRIRPARRAKQARRRGRRGQSQHHRRPQHQPARRPALARQGEGRPPNVVARRRRRLVHSQPPRRQDQPRRPPARHLGQEPGRLRRHRPQASGAVDEGRRRQNHLLGRRQRRLSLVRQGRALLRSSPSATASATPPSTTPA